jgi:serine/threonine protein kinase
MSSSSSSEVGALQPYFGPDSSTAPEVAAPKALRKPPPGKFRPTARPQGDQDLLNVELRFLGVVGRNKIPIASPEDLQLDSLDDQRKTNHGATMEVYPGTWRDRRVAVKYLRRQWSSGQSQESAYRKAMVDLNFELQIMSRPSLNTQPNITQLLAVCFQDSGEDNGDLDSIPAQPGLVVELAHEQFPDLRYFFDRAYNPDRPTQLPFEITATFISGIAKGVVALHLHDLVHADLKPGNILIFPSPSSPCGLVTKVADFGFAGMVVYTEAGKRAPLPDGRPRGGTLEWNAPECLNDADPWKPHLLNGQVPSLDHAQYSAARDVYSFGLLACYIALDGVTPKEMAPDIHAAKLSGELAENAVERLRTHYQSEPGIKSTNSIGEAVQKIAQMTLCLDPDKRIKSLSTIEDILNGQ